jgi:GH24 family phage-related lysozyme (muramidase)
MIPSENIISFLKLAEGFRARMYPDPPGSSKRAIGYGTQLTAEEIEFYRDRVFTKQQAAHRLRVKVRAVAKVVNGIVAVPLEQHEYDALVSFAYNVGTSALRASTLLRKLNAGDKAAVPSEIKRWHWAGGVPHVLDGRREAETAIWLNQNPPAGYIQESS